MDLSSVGWAVDRSSNAAAGAGVPEVLACCIELIAVEGVQDRNLRHAIRANFVANATALVVLPVVVLVAALVKADALRASPRESSGAGGWQWFTSAISDVEPLRMMASWSLNIIAVAQMVDLSSSVAFSLGEFDFYLFKL